MEEIKGFLLEVVKARGFSEPEKKVEGMEDEIKTFCKNAFENLEVTKLRPIFDELENFSIEDDMF